MDLKRLMDEADAKTVADYLGISIQRKGNRNYILCPGHRERLGKDDHKYGNCVLTAHGYRCFACGETVGTLQMVMEYSGCKKGEAFNIIAEAMGGKDLYAEHSGTEKNVKGPKVRLSQEELDLIGIGVGYNCSLVTDKGLVPEGLSVLYEEDPDRYCEMIKKNAGEKIAKYEKMLRDFSDAEAPGNYRLHELLGDKFDSKVYSEIRNELQRRLEILTGAIAKSGQQAVG